MTDTWPGFPFAFTAPYWLIHTRKLMRPLAQIKEALRRSAALYDSCATSASTELCVPVCPSIEVEDRPFSGREKETSGVSLASSWAGEPAEHYSGLPRRGRTRAVCPAAPVGWDRK